MVSPCDPVNSRVVVHGGSDRPYEPPFDMPDYKTLGTTLFQLGHSGLVDNTADLFYATDIEQQIDVKTLLADTGFTLEGTSKIDSLDLPELGAFTWCNTLNYMLTSLCLSRR